MSDPPQGPEANFSDVYFDFMDMESDDFQLGYRAADDGLQLELDDDAEERGSSTESSVANQPADSSSNDAVPSTSSQSELASGEKEERVEDDASMSLPDTGIHPLLFPDIIRDVLNFLPATDIESCRLVCRAWNTEACTVLRNKRIVVFVDPDAVRVYNNAMRSTVDFPHAQYEFCLQDFTGLLDENLREFWKVFGPHIRKLEFRQVYVFWRDVLDVIEENVPHLEKLAFKHLPRTVLRTRCRSTDERQVLTVKELRLASLPASPRLAKERLTNVLQTLPNLEVIDFLPVKSVMKPAVSFALVDALRKPEVQLRHLKRIGLGLELSATGLDALTTKQFPFQRLNLTLANGVKAVAFKNLMNSVRGTLSELQIVFPDTFGNGQSFSAKNSITPEECVQVLKNLKMLKMTNFKGSINFVQKMRSLETLELSVGRLGQAVPFGFGPMKSGFGFNKAIVADHPLKSLKLLPTSSSKGLAETLLLESISRCFPVLNSIHLEGVDDDGMGVIYRNLPFLAEVELVASKCTDQGLTGIPLEICNDMLETSTYIVVQAEKYRRDLFIGSLQYLRKLTIEAENISDASIALGLADCKNLKELKIGSPLISDTGVIFITDKFWKQLDVLDLTECSSITEQSKFYAGEKFLGNLNVADSTPEDAQAESTPVRIEKIPNPNRSIIKLKKSHASSLCSHSSSTAGTGAASLSYLNLANASPSKYFNEDSEFFEDHTDDELFLHNRGLAAYPGPHADRHRQHIFRIREAFRRNGEFMRNLQRLGVQQFRRIYRREVREGWEARDQLLDLHLHEGDADAEADVYLRRLEAEAHQDNAAFDQEEMDFMFFRPQHRDLPAFNNEGVAPFVMRHRPQDVLVLNHQELFAAQAAAAAAAAAGAGAGAGAGDAPPNRNERGPNRNERAPDRNERGRVRMRRVRENNAPPPPVVRLYDFDENGGPLGVGPAQVRFEAESEESEYSSDSDAEGEDAPNRLPEIHLAEFFRLGLRPEDIEFWFHNRPMFDRDENVNLPAVIRAVQADAIAARGREGQDEDIDLEAIRQVVMNAFGEDDLRG